MKTETQRLGGALWSLNGEDMVVGSLLDLEVAGFFWISITAQVDRITGIAVQDRRAADLDSLGLKVCV